MTCSVSRCRRTRCRRDFTNARSAFVVTARDSMEWGVRVYNGTLIGLCHLRRKHAMRGGQGWD